jgi:hypothetical protein
MTATIIHEADATTQPGTRKRLCRGVIVDGPTMSRYAAHIESRMKLFYESLSEKDRRRYAAIEVAKLGRGGMRYISYLFGCDAATIRRGAREIERLPDDEAEGRVRKKSCEPL